MYQQTLALFLAHFPLSSPCMLGALTSFCPALQSGQAPSLNHPLAVKESCSPNSSCIPKSLASISPNSTSSGILVDINHNGDRRFSDPPNSPPSQAPTPFGGSQQPTPRADFAITLPYLFLLDSSLRLEVHTCTQTAVVKTACLQAQSGSLPANRQPPNGPAPSPSRSVFDRLQQAPLDPQQASAAGSQQQRSQTPTNFDQASHGNHDMPPGFASPHQQPIGPGDLPPGFKSPRTSTAPAVASHSRMRSDHMAAASARPEQSSAQTAHSLAGQGGLPNGPPGFGALPAYLAQRLSPGPAQKSADLPNQAGPHGPGAASNSPEQLHNHGTGRSSRQHLPAAANEASSQESSDEEPPGFATANTTPGPRGPAPAAGPNGLPGPEHGSHPQSQTQRSHPPDFSSGGTALPDHNGSSQVGISITQSALSMCCLFQQMSLSNQCTLKSM